MCSYYFQCYIKFIITKHYVREGERGLLLLLFPPVCSNIICFVASV